MKMCMQSLKTRLTLIVILAILSASHAMADQALKFNNSDSPIDVRSDKMEILDNGNRIIFQGNVVLTRDDLVMHSDRLEIIMDKERQPAEITASGNLKINQGETHMRAGRASFDQAKEKLILTEEPELWNDEYTIKGDKITIFIKEKRSTVENSNLIINPKTDP